MKKSALKKYIKEQIIETLTEAAEAYELTGKTGTKTISSFKSQDEANKFKQQNPNIASIKKLEEKEEDDVEVKDDYYKVEDEDNVKPVDAPAGDKEIQKKATKQDIIIKKYKDLNQILQRYRTAYDNAKNETDKQEAFQLLKKFSQSQEWKDAKEKYAKITNIEL
jgi:hypothetical protein